MFYNPITIANYFLEKSFEEGVIITPMKLLKMVYIANGWFLGYENKPLINEVAQAWKYGPVIVSVYNTFKAYGGDMIDQMYMPTNELKQEYQNLIEDVYTTSFLDKVWEAYKDFDGLQLSELTHQEDTPWSKIYNGLNTIIPNETIREHYLKKIKELVDEV